MPYVTPRTPWLSDDEAKAICRKRAKNSWDIKSRIDKGRKWKRERIPRADWTRWAHEYDAVKQLLRMLATKCDGAYTTDNHGFNKWDAVTGRELAGLAELDEKQFRKGVKLCRKYHRQLPADMLAWLPLY